MNDSLASTLVLCDLDNLLLGEDGNLTQVVRDVLQLFSSRGGRLTVFSQRSPRAVRSILGSVRLAAPALVCGGTMAYHYADGNRVPLCSFAQQQELFACLPDTPGVGVAVQMQDGTTRVLRMSNALERHLRQEWTPYLLANAADIHPEQVLRVLLYQDSKSVPLISLAEKAIGDRVALLGERIAPDTLVLTPKRISGREMLDTVCTMAQVGAEQVLALAGGQPMLELVQAVEHSAVAADAPAELRLAAGQTYARSSAIFLQRAFFLAKNQVEWEKKPMQNKKRREELFLLLCLAAAGVCAVLAFRFAVPPQAQTPQTLPDTKELAAYTQVELNTADADALCTLPGVGPHNAQAILDYRARHGPFAQVEDAAQVPGITQAMVDSWAGQAYVR